MAQNSKQFPHVQLRLTKEGTAKPARGGNNNKINPTTASNKSDRWGHGSKLKSSASLIAADWQSSIKEREEEKKPELPDARRIILQVDPKAFDPDKLRGYGIEVIGDLEDGYIIGASADFELTELQQKIEKFLKEERGGGTIPEVWKLIDGTKKLELILSPELWKHWDLVPDEQTYTVDVGFACVGTKTQLSDCPTQKEDETIDNYSKRLNKWIEKRNLTYQEWDDIKSSREDEVTKFVVDNYKGEILSIVDGETNKFVELPDSFSCRIQISGQGFKDLVRNFPYIFEVSEPDEFAELIQNQISSESTENSFELQPPKEDAPKVCMIDSGIPEGHIYLKSAIDSKSSTCWIPGESEQTADYVKNGGHGTRVAGAILYSGNIPRTGSQQAICWLQNARVLDANCKLVDSLFPPSCCSLQNKLYECLGSYD